eukprot:2645118-Amphidinium_carterae.1
MLNSTWPQTCDTKEKAPHPSVTLADAKAAGWYRSPSALSASTGAWACPRHLLVPACLARVYPICSAHPGLETRPHSNFTYLCKHW